MKAKKSYGQHFLNREDIAERIANSLVLDGTTTKVLEIGPGRGMLTQFLTKKDYELFVVEADRDMVHYVRKYFPELKGKIIAEDFLKTNLDLYFSGEPFMIIGNFPYNISSQILFKMLDHKERIPQLVGMFQKEVGERVVADPGSKIYGVTSVLIQAYYKGEYLFTVEKGSFTPPPKVRSGVIRLTRRPEPLVKENYRLFRRIVKQAFGLRRKMLRNSMKAFIKGDPLLEDAFFNKRPEQLSIEEFVQLTSWIAERIEE